MPHCGATFDENGVPPWTRWDFRGGLGVTHNLVWAVDRGTHPGASRHPSDGGDFQSSAGSQRDCLGGVFGRYLHFRLRGSFSD